MDIEFARRFAAEWVTAWNKHDLDAILAHYTDDFEMSSPIIRALVGEPTGTLKGKTAVRDYWSKALAKFPELHFDLLSVFSGIDSVVLHYQGHRGPAAEVFFFDENGLVTRAYANYQA